MYNVEAATNTQRQESHSVIVALHWQNLAKKYMNKYTSSPTKAVQACLHPQVLY